MAYSNEQLAALQSALASGALTVSFQGRSVTYRSVAELEKAISVVQAALKGAPVRRQYRLSSSKGL